MLLSNGAVAVIAAAVERPLFSLDAQTFISIGIQLFNACVLAVALRFILYKPVRRFMQKRTDGIKNQMSTAEENNAKADELMALYEQKLTQLEQERYDMLEFAKVQIEEKNEKMISEAQSEIAAMKALADEEIRKDRERADEEMKQYVIDVASYMAGKIVSQSIDESTHERLFEEAMSELETVL